MAAARRSCHPGGAEPWLVMAGMLFPRYRQSWVQVWYTSTIPPCRPNIQPGTMLAATQARCPCILLRCRGPDQLGCCSQLCHVHCKLLDFARAGLDPFLHVCCHDQDLQQLLVGRALRCLQPSQTQFWAHPKACKAHGAPRSLQGQGLGPGHLNSQLSAASFSIAGDVCSMSTAS